jgi:hypothetical protein
LFRTERPGICQFTPSAESPLFSPAAQKQTDRFPPNLAILPPVVNGGFGETVLLI